MRDRYFSPPDDPPDEELSNQELKGRLQRSTNLSVYELREFKQSEYNDAYLDQNSSQSQPGNEPLNDMVRLLETPWHKWTRRDREDAMEALNWIRRHGAQAKDGLGENYLGVNMDMTVQEAAGIRWGVDWDDDREWL